MPIPIQGAAMTDRKSRQGPGGTITRLGKELYLSVFVLLFRISRWKGEFRAYSAALGVAVVEGILVLTFWAWIQTATKHYIEVNKWALIIAIFVIVSPTNYFLVLRGHGLAFERRFDDFSERKQAALYIAAVCIVVGVGIAFYLSVDSYHRAFLSR
jgi:hypothetical protein